MKEKLFFSDWWIKFKEFASEIQLPINDQDAESYRHYYEDDYSPEDAVIEERNHFD